MKVVIDTNVFISSFFGGIPYKIIQLWRSGKIILCLSAAIVEEYVEVLQRLGLEGEGELQELLTLFARRQNILFIKEPPTLQVIERDPDDNKFLECAVGLEAEYIVSGDKDLKDLKKYRDIEILSPREFLMKVKDV